MDVDNVSKIIKAIREKYNLTQDELSKQLNVTPQAISKWERALSIPDISILKDISKKYNININDILDGNIEVLNKEQKEDKKKNNNYYKILIIIIISVLIIIIIYLLTRPSYEVKTISSTCSAFKISGNIAYDSKKSSIFITNIDYCDINDEKYKIIKCNLYEQNNNTKTIISTCNNKNNKNITLSSYLKDVKFDIENYKSSCINFKDAKIYLDIEATDNNNKITKYNVPIKFEDCN